MVFQFSIGDLVLSASVDALEKHVAAPLFLVLGSQLAYRAFALLS